MPNTSTPPILDINPEINTWTCIVGDDDIVTDGLRLLLLVLHAVVSLILRTVAKNCFRRCHLVTTIVARIADAVVVTYCMICTIMVHSDALGTCYIGVLVLIGTCSLVGIIWVLVLNMVHYIKTMLYVMLVGAILSLCSYVPMGDIYYDPVPYCILLVVATGFVIIAKWLGRPLSQWKHGTWHLLCCASMLVAIAFAQLQRQFVGSDWLPFLTFTISFVIIVSTINSWFQPWSVNLAHNQYDTDYEQFVEQFV